MTRPKPLVLAILDGWGHTETHEHNAIAMARTSTMDMLSRIYPHGLLNASELHVGLPSGQMGNSEVGHMNIGSGRVVMQELPRIDAAIESGELKKKISALAQTRGVVHLLGLLSPGGVHAHQTHLAAVARVWAGLGFRVWVHVFLDGRDTPPESALEYLNAFERDIADVAGAVRIATVSGRYYAMDRDKRWERVQLAYDALVDARARRHDTAQGAIEASYAEGVTDEFMLPVAIGDYAGMEDGDVLMHTNFRADRVRQLLSALVDPAFSGFARSKKVAFARAIGMVEYAASLSAFVTPLFAAEKLERVLGEVIAREGLRQLRIAETEKYAHVTFFFNGGREEEFAGEERILVPSPKVATYDVQPEMSAPEVTDKLVAAIESGRFDVIVVNYANTDMVGHSGNTEAAIKAVEAVDSGLGRVFAAVEKAGGALIVTADHGNAEQMHDDESEQAHTAHTLNLVPFIVAAPQYKHTPTTLPDGRLCDVAPTMLALLGIPQPAEMTGRALTPDA